jgi:hypothetical protein
MKSPTCIWISAAFCGLVGCAPAVMINPYDDSAPDVRVTLVSPQSVQATYDDNAREAVSGNLEPNRTVTLAPAGDRVRVMLLFTGEDINSGVREVAVHVRFSFRCIVRQIDRSPIERSGAAQFGTSWGPVMATGTTAPPRAVATARFSLEDMWQQSCSLTGGLDSGKLLMIRGSYRVEAFNHAGLSRIVEGNFTLPDAEVDIWR